MINVTKPFLPPVGEYEKYLKGIWGRGWLTNNGPLVNELELALKEYLKLDHFLFLNNGTIALQIAIKALELKGEVITTPFSYVATTSSIVWEGCKPVFVDIDPLTLNIDPDKIEAAITPETSGIIATHVYGNPCDIDAISIIAKKHNLKVIYDAAHCFGTKYKGRSVYTYGDVSTASFHSTKLFHTVEGGGVFTGNSELAKKMDFMRNFGHNGPDLFEEVGINGKNSEFHAAMGIVNLKWADKILESRKQQSERYDLKLTGCNVAHIKYNPSDFNYSYYPVIFESEGQMQKALDALNSNWVYPRRYFHPSLNKLKYVQHTSMPVSEDISRRIICLPLYFELTTEEIDFVCRILNAN
jgi:dTDP-4-amino-4,6-dideoxygalactose transaminase